MASYFECNKAQQKSWSKIIYITYNRKERNQVKYKQSSAFVQEAHAFHSQTEKKS